MAPYRIVLYNEDGLAAEERTVDFSADYEAIEHVAWIDNPHDISMWESGRLVVRCAPWSAPVSSGGSPGSPAHTLVGS